jgi:transposase
MLNQEQRVEIRVMARRGVAVKAIARELGCSRNTVRRYLRDAGAGRYKRREARVGKLDEHRDYLAARVQQAKPRWIPATVLMREIQERGYSGGLSTLKSWLAPQKHSEADPVVRFETAAGEQLQADFTHVRRGRDPLLALVATLGYSRASYVAFGDREDAGALCTGLREAFDYFGGVPQHVLFDNTKAVVIERDANGAGLRRWNEQMNELAESCGCTPRLCRPYRAKTKGKVERFNSYLKGSFVVPLASSLEASGLRFDVDVANRHVRRWLDEVANVRIHGTTGRTPFSLLPDERAVMLPAPALKAPPRMCHRVVMPVESLQHPLSVYDDLLRAVA